MLTLRRLAQRLSSLCLLLFAVTTPLVWPAIVLAQNTAPQPTARKVPPVWLGYLIIFALLVVVMVVSMMPSKRSHQD